MMQLTAEAAAEIQDLRPQYLPQHRMARHCVPGRSTRRSTADVRGHGTARRRRHREPRGRDVRRPRTRRPVERHGAGRASRTRPALLRTGSGTCEPPGRCMILRTVSATTRPIRPSGGDLERRRRSRRPVSSMRSDRRVLPAWDRVVAGPLTGTGAASDDARGGEGGCADVAVDRRLHLHVRHVREPVPSCGRRRAEPGRAAVTSSSSPSQAAS